MIPPCLTPLLAAAKDAEAEFSLKYQKFRKNCLKNVFRCAMVVFILLGAFAAAVHFRAQNSFQDIMASIADADGLQIALKDYRSGRSVDLVDAATIETIRKSISEIQYGGLFWGEDLITPADQAYSLIAFSKQSHAVFTISACPGKSRVIGSPFTISIDNYDSLYETVKRAFD